jgi:hypothetical protein
MTTNGPKIVAGGSLRRCRRGLMLGRLAIGVVLAGSPSAAAIEIKMTKAADGKTHVMELSGALTQGDGLKLRGEIAGLPAGATVVAHLSINGGSQTEAMSIGRLFQTLRIRTVVPPKARCYAPCHLVLVGGKSPDSREPAYVKHSSGTIGFVPFTDNAVERQYEMKDLYAAVENTQQSILRVADYLTEVGADLDLLRLTYEEVAPGGSRALRDEDALSVGIAVHDDTANRLVDSKPFRRRTN